METEPATESFASLLAESEQQRREVERGEIVRGRIVQIGSDYAFIDLGAKSEGAIALDELRDAEGQVTLNVGDEIEAHVLSVGHQGIMLSRSLAKKAQSRALLEEAADTGMPVEGTVTAVNKGGLEVQLAAGVRAFCPVSQIDLRYCEDPSLYVGQHLSFRITEFKDTKNVVVSRRALLQAEQEAKAVETRKRLEEGAVLTGTVSSLRDFGAFVDLGGIEGLIHISEISHVRVGHPSEALQEGQEVEVQVKRVEETGDAKRPLRVGLSLKALERDPWETVQDRFPVGARCTGRIARLQTFGAFVEIAPGIDGLVHISRLGAGRRIAHPKEVVAEGQEVEVTVLEVDAPRKRISLSMEDEGAAPQRDAEPTASAPRLRVGQVVDAQVDKVENFGIFVSFEGGRGLIPNREMGTAPGTDHRKDFGPGTTLKAAIIEIDAATKRIRLSRQKALDAEERANFEQFMHKSGSSGLGTLGDLLREKLK